METTAAWKRKQVPEGYLIIGVDPHKKRHAAVAITQDFTAQDRFKFDNTREGLESMLRRARIEMVKANCRGVMFAIETGGHYWRNIAYFLEGRSVPYRFINQFTLKRRREGKDLNRRKNDYRKLIVLYRCFHFPMQPKCYLVRRSSPRLAPELS